MFNQQAVQVLAPDVPATFVLYSYLVYLLVSIAVTVWVARTLHANGRAFLLDAFHGQESLADSVNHLLVVGFYLINLGWIVMTLRTRQDIVSGMNGNVCRCCTYPRIIKAIELVAKGGGK